MDTHSNHPASELTAVDILLNPDAAMASRAKAANDQLREKFPAGFPLDALHAPHISLLQRHVRTRDLDSVYAAVQRVFESENLADLQMRAIKYYYFPFSVKGAPMGDAGIVIEPSERLIGLQQKLVDAVSEFTEQGGTAAAYITDPKNAEVLKVLIQAVDSFVPKFIGKNYKPHVSVGIGHIDYLKELIAKPFETFSFGFDSIAVYQLGDFGTAAKQLWSRPRDAARKVA